MTATILPLRAYRLARLLRAHGFSVLSADMLASVVENATSAQARVEALRENGINGLLAASFLVRSGYIVREPCERCGVECNPKTAWAFKSNRGAQWRYFCGRVCGEIAMIKNGAG